MTISRTYMEFLSVLFCCVGDHGCRESSPTSMNDVMSTSNIKVQGILQAEQTGINLRCPLIRIIGCIKVEHQEVKTNALMIDPPLGWCQKNGALQPFIWGPSSPHNKKKNSELLEGRASKMLPRMDLPFVPIMIHFAIPSPLAVSFVCPLITSWKSQNFWSLQQVHHAEVLQVPIWVA